MFSLFQKISLFLILIVALILPNFSVISQEDCQTVKECEALWEKLQGEIKNLEGKIAKTEQEKKTLQNQISLLRSRIQKLTLQIQQSNIMIKDISYQIADTETSIRNTSLKIDSSKEKLVGLLRTVYEEDQKSLIEILFSESTLSGFFDNLMALEVLNLKSQEVLENIKGLKSTLEKQKEELDEEKENLAQILKVQTIQKQESEAAKKKQEEFLKMTKAQYQQHLKEKKELEKRAAEIRARIAQLTLRGLKVPQTNKELYELASWAGKAAGGVRPALILGLLEVESALGVNVGQCNCAGQPVCRHPELSYKEVMKSNQWPAFEAIVQELVLNLNTTPVSCYVDGGKVQMGGAMGPAQFMPTTWLKYRERVESITGEKPANPWRAGDAFLAAALYLADWNASTRDRQSEIGAVTAYLCGTSAMTSACSRAGGEWYRNLVMEKADWWQQQIDQGI